MAHGRCISGAPHPTWRKLMKLSIAYRIMRRELRSLLSSLLALWVLRSSSFCISTQGKQMQNTILLGGCVPLVAQLTPSHQCFFSRLTAFWVPFRPRASSTETVAGFSSSPHSFSSFLLQEQRPDNCFHRYLSGVLYGGL